MADNMANNAKIQQELLETMKAILVVMEAQNKVAKDQVGVQQAVRDAAKETQESIEDGFGSMASQAEKLSEGMSNFQDQLKKVEKALPAVAFKGFIDGASKGLRFVKNTFTSLVGAITQAASSIMNMGKAIASIPFRIMSNLIKAANDLAERFKHIAEAYESFRKEFGDLNNEIGTSMKSALSGAEQMGKFGVGFYNIFTDQAAAIQFFSQAFSDLGPLVDTFASEIADMGEEFTVLTKSLGISGESLRAVGSLAKATGKSMKSVLSEIGAQADVMQRAFGVSSKLIGKDLGSMVADVRSFGNNSIKTLSAAAMRMRSLGLEVKVLGKLVDKFLNFEDAAKSASMLSQSFGVNLDTLKLMNAAAEGGAGVMDQLRNAMFSAGRDASKMSTAELRLLAQQTGLSEEEARLAFAMENRGKSMEEIQKMAKKADPQERMADTMERLANNIERVIRVFKFDSFFGAFIKGFSKGVGYGKPFVAMLQNLYKSLNIVHWSGYRIGKMFTEVFPGFKQMADGLAKIFDPKRYEKFASSIEAAFDTLFKGLKAGGDPVKIMSEFWNSLMESFDLVSMFKGEATDQFREGFMSFMGGMRDIIIGTLPMAVDYFADGIKMVVSLLSGEMPDAFKNAAGEAEGFGAEFWTNIIDPIQKAFEKEWPRIKESLSLLGSKMLEALVNIMSSIGIWLVSTPAGAALLAGIGTFLTASILGPAMMGMLGAIFSSFASLIGPAISTAITSAGGAGAVGSAFAGFISSALAFITNPWFWIPLAIAAIGALGVAMDSGIEKFMGKFSEKFEDTGTAKVASAAAGIVDALTLGLLPDSLVEWFGTKAGEIVESIKRGLSSLPLFGEDMSERFGTTFEAAIDTLSGIGGIIKDIFSGEGINSDKMAAVFESFFTWLGNGAVLGQEMLISMVIGFVGAVFKYIPIINAYIGSALFQITAGFFKFLGNLTSGIPVVREIFWAIGALFEGIGNFISWLSGKWSGFTDTISSWLGGDEAAKAQEVAKSAGKGIGEGLNEGIAESAAKGPGLASQITADASSISAAANNIPELNVPVTLQPTSSGNLDIKNKKLEFTSDALHIVLNLNVTMESDKLADVILETKKVMPREKV